MENPPFRGQFWGFGGKVSLNLGPMDFVPKRDSSLRQTTSFDVLRAQIGHRVFEKKLLDPLSVIYDLEK